MAPTSILCAYLLLNSTVVLPDVGATSPVGEVAGGGPASNLPPGARLPKAAADAGKGSKSGGKSGGKAGGKGGSPSPGKADDTDGTPSSGTPEDAPATTPTPVKPSQPASQGAGAAPAVGPHVPQPNANTPRQATPRLVPGTAPLSPRVAPKAPGAPTAPASPTAPRAPVSPQVAPPVAPKAPGSPQPSVTPKVAPQAATQAPTPLPRPPTAGLPRPPVGPAGTLRKSNPVEGLLSGAAARNQLSNRPSARPADGLVGPPPAFRRDDLRYARPNPVHVVRHPEAGAPPPRRTGNRARYARWWVHPYWRYQHATYLIVLFPYPVWPLNPAWAPPARAGWTWVPGQMVAGLYRPGNFVPEVPGASGYVWESGWWLDGDTYMDGFWRITNRTDGEWRWVAASLSAEGRYQPGWWEPAGTWPEGMTWEPGFFDGETWVEGFFRPIARENFVWVPARWDENGIRHEGHWMPLTIPQGMTYIPGWFDGTTWVEGRLAPRSEIQGFDAKTWTPAPGREAGWGQAATPPAEAPLAIAVD